ncbi:hypothetical protein MKI79_09580 [Acinetobacter sp. A3.8]|uniref:Uncharacterized protein n=1 Tax=Acinetobacter sedimenti TaxID=2919922 RepID=A0A9X2B7J1_9GAMM|nr:hypothetical protein [Acinetobacter sedimenti]MCJ8147142.1 hypothetical protein [Acinetobacter sedimenti]
MSNHNASVQYKNGGNLVIDDEDRTLFKNHTYQTKFKSIIWSYWIEKPKVKCYEAVLLTLGLNPEKIDYPSRVWATQLNSDDRNALDERIDNFKMLIGKGKLFESDVEEDLGVEVKLKKVAEYLKKRNATMPTELIQLVSKNENNTISPPDHIRRLSLSDFFTVVQAACLISNDEPGRIQALIDSHDLRYDSWNYGEHTQAVETIKKGIKAKKLIQDADGDIPRASLQKFLFEKNHIIAGFNDNPPSQDQSTFGIPSIQQNEPNVDNLNAEIAQLKDQLAQAQQRIQELEVSQKFQHASLDLNNKNHAPELLLAIQAWEARYINNEYPHMEHTPAIKAYLAKNGYTVTRLKERISAITNPKNINKSDN